MTLFIGWVLYMNVNNDIQNKGPHVVALLHHHHQWPMKVVFWELHTNPILEVKLNYNTHNVEALYLLHFLNFSSTNIWI